MAKKFRMRFSATATCDGASVKNVFKELRLQLIEASLTYIDGPDDIFDSVPDAIQTQPLELDLYQRALKDGAEIDRSVRINIVGSYRQGKTSLMKRLLRKGVSGMESTNGIDVHHFKCERSSTGKLTYKKSKTMTNDEIIERLKTVSFQTGKETINQELRLAETSEKTWVKDIKSKDDVGIPFESPRKSVVRFKYDITSSDSKEPTTKQLNEGKIKRTPTAHLLKDKEKKTLIKALEKRQFEDHTKPAKIYFDFWDFGGQFVFYATHSIFHCRKAIYLLVFDLTLSLDTTVSEDFPGEECKRTVEYYLRFWMNSVHAFVGTKDGREPVVILVGTHKDRLPGKPCEKSIHIRKFFDEVRKLFEGTSMLNHIFEEDFAVDNTSSSDPAIAALREAILKIGEEKSKTIHFPAKWIQLEQSLNNLKSMKITLLQTIIDMDMEHDIPLGDVEQVKLFLKYHHEKGTYMYFDEAPLSDYVILDPQFLIDAFKSIITSRQFCARSAKLRPFWTKLVTEARLENELIESQWGKEKIFAQHKNILISFLEKHHIIAEAQEFDEASQKKTGLGWYVVPSLLKDSPDVEIQEFTKGKQGTLLLCALKFEHSAIVPLVYQRLQAAVIGKWPLIKYTQQGTARVMIFENACIVKIKTFAGIASLDTPSICLAVVSLCPSVPVDLEVTDSFRRFCETLVQQEFRKLQSRVETHEQPYEVKFKCNHESHGFKGSYAFVETDENPIAHCPDFKTHDINIAKGKGEWFAEGRQLDVNLNVRVTDRMLSSLSQAIGVNWELLGTGLGLTDVQIDQIKADNCTTALRVFRMLMIWKNIATEARLHALVQAMKANAAVNIDWDIVRNIADETK